MSSKLHFGLAQAYSKEARIDLANACYRTASYLGGRLNPKLIDQKIPDLFNFPVDQYIRFKTVADSINTKYRNVSVLDVGGGNGLLGYFLPKQNYILVDKKTNGIQAIPLPFGSNSIDIVCTTDTLEHIPKNLRIKFVSEIIRVARKEINIVVPTKLSSKYPDYNKFFYKMTGALQTKEHIKYGVPTIKELHSLLKPYEELITYEIQPCGSLINIALILLWYLIDKKEGNKISEINRYFNKYFYKEIKNTDLPIAHYIKIEKRN